MNNTQIFKAFVQSPNNFVISKIDTNKMILQALIPFTDLNSKAFFTQKSLTNESGNVENHLEVEKDAEYYQRKLDPKRLQNIRQYIYSSILNEKYKEAVSALFPTSMILALNLEDLPENEKDNIVELDLNFIDKIFIVDGQHRLMAMRLLYKILNDAPFLDEDEKYIKNYLEHYNFCCTILVNFDIWEQSLIFVKVNFTQKPVNRSLYYDIYGEEYIENDNKKLLEHNKIYIAHEIISFLNEEKTSPFYKKIKMLGTGEGYISQAFFVEAILRLFMKNGIWFYDTATKEELESTLNSYKSEIYNYYCVIAESFKKYWGYIQDHDKTKKKKVRFICKTTGIGALTRLMATLHKELNYDIIKGMSNIVPGTDYEKYKDFIRNLISPIVSQQDKLLREGSEFEITGGRGLESKFYKTLIQILIDNNMLNNYSNNDIHG